MNHRYLKNLKLKPSTSKPNILNVGIAMYKNKLVFVKQLSTSDNILKNEINNYKFLNTVSSKEVYIPKLLYHESSKNKSFMALEYVNGVDITKLSYDKKIRIFVKVIDFLQSIDINNKLTRKFSIISRKPIFYLITMPYITLRALINFPKSGIVITKSFLLFFLKASSLFKSKLVFSHRDIDIDNIIMSKEKICLLDFQYSVITCSEFDYASILRSIINDDKFVNVFIQDAVIKSLETRHSRESFKVLSIYYAMLGLIDLKFPKQRSLDFIKMLNYIDNLNI